MKIDLAVLNRQYELHAAEYDAAALRALRSGWYIMGPELSAFETEFAAYTGGGPCRWTEFRTRCADALCACP